MNAFLFVVGNGIFCMYFVIFHDKEKNALSWARFFSFSTTEYSEIICL